MVNSTVSDVLVDCSVLAKTVFRQAALQLGLYSDKAGAMRPAWQLGPPSQAKAELIGFTEVNCGGNACREDLGRQGACRQWGWY